MIKVPQPERKDIFKMRFLIFLGLITVLLFMLWFFSDNRVGYAPLFWLLCFVWFFKIIRTLHEWYHYYSLSVPKPPPSVTPHYTVDVLTTACPGEPVEMIIATLQAMKAIRYPHTSYLCDEGNDPLLKKTCEDLGIIHVTRIEKKNAKAGNINNALKIATGQICIILDPDHVPVPEFIDQVLPYFDDPEVGFVQSVQAYKNRKESLVALGACEQTYHFYGPMMMSMNSYGTVQAIGANCAFRREALDSIGGHAAGLAEDMHTSMLLHAKGWKSIYIPEILTRGLVPSSLPAYYKQQLKWSKGTFDIFFKTLPKIFFKLSWRQRFHYLTVPLYFFYGIIDFLNIVIPVLSLVLAEFPWQVDLFEFLSMSFPVLIMTILIRQNAQKWLLEKHERGFHFVGGLLRIGTWWIFSLGFIYTLFNKNVPYIPTPKDGKPENSWRLSIPNIIACLLTAFAIFYGLHLDSSPYSYFMASLALLNIFILGYVIMIGQQKTVLQVYRAVNASAMRVYLTRSRIMWWNLRQGVYFFLRKNSFYAGCLTIVFVFAVFYTGGKEFTYASLGSESSPGKYYSATAGKRSVNLTSNIPLKVYSFDCDFTDSAVNKIEFFSRQMNKGEYMLINLDLYRKEIFLTNEFIHDMLSGSSDRTVFLFGEELRKLNTPVFLFLNAGINNHPMIQKLYEYMKGKFEEIGVSNVIWVSNNRRATVADWLLVNPNELDLKLISSEARKSNKPLLLVKSNEIGSSTLSALIKKYPQIQGVACKFENFNAHFSKSEGQYKISDYDYKFHLTVNNEDFFIQGIAYKESGFFNEGHIPLTRSQLKKDFSKIQDMGGNTIRRYHPSIYDKNIFDVASDYNLKILYGFWFDPEVKDLEDSSGMEEYCRTIEKNVIRFKNSPALLGWTLENTTYYHLKHLYHKPELIFAKKSYLIFLERLVTRIKQLDPLHPVFITIPYSDDLAAVVRDLNSLVPSADAIGVSVYNSEQMKKVPFIMKSFNKTKPWFFSEFGLENFGVAAGNSGSGKSDHEKAKIYFWNWIKNILFNKNNCLGGVAFVWRDKNEITSSGGLTDYEGRLKPAYYSLKKIWKDKKLDQPMPWVYIECTDVFQKGKKYKFSCKKQYNGDFNYEWFAQTEKKSGKSATISLIGKEEELVWEVPKNSIPVRLYLYVSDQDGNVVTSSFSFSSVN